MNFAELLAKAKAAKLAKRKDSPATVSPDVKKSRGSEEEEKKSETIDFVQFMIIGVQKAGTSAAVANLSKHKDIWLKPDQVHFFDRWYSKGLKHYKDIMKCSKKEATLIGEKTPTYIYCDGCMERIKAAAPNTKFLLFLREPISRAYSHWNMVTQNMRQEHYSFNECVDRELTTLMTEPKTFNNALLHYVQRGFYMDQIEAFLKIFPREQLLVVIAERIRKDPVEEHKRIFEFLGVEATEIVAEDKHLGNYKEKTVPPKTKARLDALYAPHNERLYEFLGERITEWEEPEPVAVEDSDKDGKEEDKDESESKEVDVEEAAKKE